MNIGENTLTFMKDAGFGVDIHTDLYDVYVADTGVVLTKKDDEDEQYYIANKKTIKEVYNFKENKDEKELTIKAYVHEL